MRATVKALKTCNWARRLSQYAWRCAALCLSVQVASRWDLSNLPRPTLPDLASLFQSSPSLSRVTCRTEAATSPRGRGFVVNCRGTVWERRYRGPESLFSRRIFEEPLRLKKHPGMNAGYRALTHPPLEDRRSAGMAQAWCALRRSGQWQNPTSDRSITRRTACRRGVDPMQFRRGSLGVAMAGTPVPGDSSILPSSLHRLRRAWPAHLRIGIASLEARAG